MPEPTTPVRIEARGMREDKALLANQPEFAESIRNMDYDPEGFWEPAPGTLQVGTWVAGTGACIGLTWFQPRPGLRWLVVEREVDDATSELRVVNWPAGTTSQLTTRRRLANGPGGQFLEHGRWLYHLNGLEGAIRWDGDRIVPVGWAAPPPAPLVAGPDQGLKDNSGTDEPNDRAGVTTFPSTWTPPATPATHQRGVGEYVTAGNAPWRKGYAVTWLNDLGQESPLSPLAWASGVNDTTNFRKVVRISVGPGPDHARKMRLYATRNTWNVTGSAIDSAAEVYLHTEVGHAFGFDLIDLLSDSDLAPVLFDRDSVGPTPPNPSVGAFWQGRLWLFHENTAQWSAPQLFEQFPTENRAPVGGVSTGPVVGCRAIPKGLIVWTTTATFIIKATGSTFGVETLSETEGLAARNSVIMVPGVGLAWLAYSGPKIMTGILEADLPTTVAGIKGIRKTWRRTQPRLDTACVMHDPEKQHVWWHVSEGGNVYPESGLVWHYGTQEWSIRPPGSWPIAAATRYLGRIYVASHDDSTDAKAGVHVLTRGSATRFGTGRDARYFTGFLSGETRSLVQHIVLHVIGLGDATVQVEYRGDRGQFVAQHETARKLQFAEEERDKWGTGLWGDAYEWGDHEPAMVRLSLDRNNAFTHAWKFTGDRLRLVAFEPHLDPQGAPLVLPLQERRD